MTVLSVAVFGLAMSSSVQANYTDTANSDLYLSVGPVVSLSISNCDSSEPSNVNLSIEPSSIGSFGSTCQNIGVAANTPGYSLSIKTSSTDLLYQNPTSLTPAPIVASTDKLMNNPAVLSNDTWGFAIEKQAGMDSGIGFDATYTIDNENNKYAKLLTTDQTIYQTDKALGETPTPLDTFTAYYGAKLTLATIAGEYRTTITYSAIGADVPEPPEIACVTGRKFKGDVGDIRNVAAKTAAWGVGYTGIATDTRGDGQEYCIGELADGNIWMLNNLKLGSLTSPIVLTPTDTNIASNWTLPQIDNSTTGIEVAWYDAPHSYALISDQPVFNVAKPNSEETGINSPNFAGYYYDWCAATAGIVTTTCAPSGNMPPDAIQDICPANWRMPIGGSSGEFATLSTAMTDANNNSAYQNFQFDGPFRGAFAGFRWGPSSSWEYQGDYGYIWSASRSTAANYFAVSLSFRSGVVFPDQGTNRDAGLPVRCLLKP
jgi:uncharacterized protein (TIGR02145 family)